MRALLLLLCSLSLLAQTNPWKRVNGVISPRKAGDSVSICATLPGSTCGGTLGAANKYVITYTNAAFREAATAVSIPLGQLPALGEVHRLRMKHSVAFAGTGITAMSCSLGDGTNHTAYSPAFDVFQAVSDTAQHFDAGAYSASAAAHTLTLRCTANVNVGTGAATVLTAGSLTIWIDTAVRQ